jgi:hypothetical protein
MISCYKCNKKFAYAYLLKRHLSGKLDCRRLLETKTFINENKPKPTNTNEFVKDNCKYSGKCAVTTCDYCCKTITKIKLTPHIRNSCMKVPDDVRERYIEKYNNRKDIKTKKSILDNVNNNTDRNIDTINNINNNINTKNIDNSSNSHNTINNNNITINVNTFNHESVEHLTKEDHLKLLNTGVNMYNDYLKAIYNLDDNLNIYIEDKRKGIVGYMDKDKTVSYMREAKAVDMLTDKNMSELNNLYDEYEEELEEVTKKKANFNLDRYFNDAKDGPVKQEYRDMTYFMILKKSKLAKKRLNDFVKLKDKDGNVMKLKDENGEEWVLVNPNKVELEVDSCCNNNSDDINSNDEQNINQKTSKVSINK